MSGIFGYRANPGQPAAPSVYLGLFALQHRGEQSCGMVVSDGEQMGVRKGVGLVPHLFPEESIGELRGHMALGHVNSMPGPSHHTPDALPLYFVSRHGAVALAHDGRLTNAPQLRQSLLDRGALLQTAHDAELIAHLLAEKKAASLEEAVQAVASDLQGAFSVVMMSGRTLIGFRDPRGIRPLSLGTDGDQWYVSSESCAFDTVGARLVRDVAPGEMVVIDDSGVRSYRYAPQPRSAFCVFEFIYFARADSVIDGKSVHEMRKEFGRRLAREAGIAADLIVPAPDSALSAAIGYAEESGIPFDTAITKNRYVGRTFVQSTPIHRERGVHIKLNPISSIVKNRRVILVDDSIVRGTTSGKAISMLREAGAAQVHMVVASPPFSHPCQYGMHIPTPGELIAARRSNEEICALIGADSLWYLSLDSLYAALDLEKDQLCAACFGEGYPINEHIDSMT